MANMSATAQGEGGRIDAARAEARQRAEAGDLTGARTLMEDALAAGELQLGREHPALTPLMVDLATIARELGNLTEAQNQLRRAHSIVAGSSGGDDAAALSIEGRLAAVSHRLGDPTEALDRHLADVGGRVLGTEHAAVRAARRRLAAPRPAESPPEPSTDLPDLVRASPYPSTGPYAGLGVDLEPAGPRTPDLTSPHEPAVRTPPEPAVQAAHEPAVQAAHEPAVQAAQEPEPDAPYTQTPSPYDPPSYDSLSYEPPPYEPKARSPYEPKQRSQHETGPRSPYETGPNVSHDPKPPSPYGAPAPPETSAYLPSATFPGVYDRQSPVAGWQGAASDRPSVTPPLVTPEWRGTVGHSAHGRAMLNNDGNPAHVGESAVHGRPLGDGIYVVDPPPQAGNQGYDEVAPLVRYAPGRPRPRQGHGGAALVVSLGLVVLLAGGVVIYRAVKTSAHGLVPSGAIETPAANDPTQTPTAGPTPAAPGPVALTDNGGSVTLAWSDPSDGKTPFIVAGGRVGSPSRPLVTIPRGQQTSTIYGLNKSYNYCFTVTAVYSSTVTASSPQVCTARKLPGGSPPGSPTANRPPMMNGAPGASAEARGWAS